MKTDIEFTTDGMFTTLYPVTQAGHEAWLHILEIVGSSKIPSIQFASVKTQLKEAGYTVRKARQVKMTDDQLLAELGL